MQNHRQIHKLNILKEAPNLFDVCTIFILPLELQTRLIDTRSYLYAGAGGRRVGRGTAALPCFKDELCCSFLVATSSFSSLFNFNFLIFFCFGGLPFSPLTSLSIAVSAIPSSFVPSVS